MKSPKKYLRNFLPVLLILSMLLAGCTASEVSVSEKAEESEVLQDGTVVDAELYTVERINGKYYLEPKKGKEKDPYWYHTDVLYLGIVSKGPQDMYNKIYGGDLTQDDLDIAVNQFPRDENDRIPICDFRNLFSPIDSNGYSCKGMILFGETYELIYSSDSSNDAYVFTTVSTGDYEKLKEYFYRPSNRNVSSTIFPDGESAVYIYENLFNMYKTVKYVSRSENKELFVEEFYIVRPMPTNPSISPEEYTDGEVLNRVNIVGTHNGVTFKVRVNNEPKSEVSSILDWINVEKAPIDFNLE